VIYYYYYFGLDRSRTQSASNRQDRHACCRTNRSKRPKAKHYGQKLSRVQHGS
jgi:hypothetical protein